MSTTNAETANADNATSKSNGVAPASVAAPGVVASAPASASAPALANPILQEALGVTATGTCLRHPNCPVMVHSKIMSCRICFSEEKSSGGRSAGGAGTQTQQKSFAAVIQQVQRNAANTATANANAAAASTATSGGGGGGDGGSSPMSGIGHDATDLATTDASLDNENNNMATSASSSSTAAASTEVDVLQQPHALESLMKRLAQVQNWVLRQTEKEVTSLQLQIQRLEQRLSDAEHTVTEQSQTVRALRRTIQQDLKIIKTMAMQKEQLDAAVFRFAESQVAEEEGEEEAGEGGEAGEGEAEAEQAGVPEAPKAEGNYGSPSRRTLGRSRAPMARGNMARGKSAPLSDMALSLQGFNMSSDRSVSPRKRSILETPSPDHKKIGLQDRLMKRSGRRPSAADKDKDKDSDANKSNPKPSAARGPPPRRAPPGRTLSSDGLDFSMPIPENSGHEPDAIFGGPKFAESNRASSYWNDNDVSTAHNPSKLFASFRGGLLDIPKSPPQARHDSNNKLKQKPKLAFDTSMMDALRLPSMRGGMGGESGPSTVESIPKKKMGNPMGLLTAKLHALPLAPEDSSLEGGSSPELTPKAAAVVGLLAATTTTIKSSASNLLPPPLLSSDDDGNDVGDAAGAGAGAAKQADDGTVQDNKESTLYSVTKVESVDNYGDPGLYTGTILAAGGLPHGKGTMTYDSGRFFEGNWSSGQWNGKGKLLNPNGDVYEGDFIMDARHGKGLYKWDNGDVYVGDFSQDERHGRGKFSFHNGNVYDGEFCDGMFDGYGQYDFTDGHYEGEWKEGRYDGQGKLTYSTGGMYTGDFKNSVAHGFGVEVTPDGNERKGVWDNGQPVDFER
jgi:hypothetical protein